MPALEELRRRYERLLEWLVIALMAVLFVEVTIGVVYRTFGASLAWYDEVASILLAWLTFYGSALAAVKRAHIGCPEVIALLGPRVRVALRIAATALVVAFFALLGWMGYAILEVLATDHLISLPEVEVAWVQSVIPVSSVLIIIAELLSLPLALRHAHGAESRPAGEASQ